jgi:drug/metabolite transporter (DMT)-like permease
VALIAAFRGTERLTPVRTAALILALTGVTIMVGAPTERLNPAGVALALGSALLYSAYLPALGHVQEGTTALLSTFVLVLGAAGAFLIAALLAGELYAPTDASIWINIFLLAFVSTVIAFSFLIKGLSVLGPVRTAIIATVEPFFTAVLGVLVLRNEPRLSTLVGGMLIAAAVLMIEWSSARAAAIA